MSIEHKWRLMFRYVPRFWIPNVNIRGDGRAPVTTENRGFRNRAYDDGRVEPLCAVYHRRCHAPILASLESGIRKITNALRRLEADGFAVRYLPVSSAEPFANLNTPDEVQKYLNG